MSSSLPSARTWLALPPRAPSELAHRWLSVALRAGILDGRLRPGSRLPSTRDLAAECGLSRGTIVAAFDRLQAEGYLRASVGSGTFVNEQLPDDLLKAGRPAVRRAPEWPAPRRRLSSFARNVRSFPRMDQDKPRAFRANLPAVDLFPTTLWAQVSGRRLRRANAPMLRGCESLGYLPLRQAVADYLGASRGVSCRPEQVVIVSGIQEALDLVVRLFLDPGDRVVVENPGYVGATRICEALGAHIVSMAVDDEGMCLEARRMRGARLVYVTPAHQFPLGMAMSLPRRMALLEWARAQGALIFEDDYDSEYRYAGRPMPAVHGVDWHGVVLFAGTFSKVLFPSLRLGYLVVPPDLVELVSAAKSVTSRHASVPDQAALCDFITEGHSGRHVRRMRGIYAERLGVLVEESSRRLKGLLEISGVEAGLQTVGWLREGIDGEQATRAAARRNLEVLPLSRYTRGQPAREGLQLGFAAVDATEIRRGVLDLAAALESVRNSRRR